MQVCFYWICQIQKAGEIALVNEIVQKKGKVGTVSSGWWESFRKRHPNLVLEEKRISQQKEVVVVRHENNDDHTQDHEEGSLDREQELDAEASLSECRFQEGYDERYNEWVRRFHPSTISIPGPSL